MKRYVLFIAALIGTPCAFAQPIINKLYDFPIGHVYSYKKVPANWNIDTSKIQTVGTNLLWEFDTLTLEPTIYSDSILSPSGTPGSASFSGAQFVWKEYSGTLQYYTRSADTIFYMGNYSGWASVFTPNPITAILPTSYSTGNVYSNFITNVSGNGQWTYDARYNAYGTLKLPGITHTNVGLYVTVGGKSNLKFADYFWFKENQSDPVMRIQFVWTLNSSAVQYLYVNTTALTPLGSNNLTQEHVDIYPNPCQDRLYIHPNQGSIVSDYVIYNLLGLAVQTGQLKDAFIQVSNLAPGTYVLALGGSQGLQNTKLFFKQ